MAWIDQLHGWPARVRRSLSWLRRYLTWEYIKRSALVLVTLFVIGVIVHHVVRECTFSGIVLESVVVKGPTGENAATVEMVGQQIATYIDAIQKTGAREWRPHDLDDGQRDTVSIQIPGSSLTVESVVREIANLFPHRRRSLRISITPNPLRGGYTAAVAITDREKTTRATCEADGSAGSLGYMFECLAIESMKVIDPLFAASYVLAKEERACTAFEVEAQVGTDRVAEKKHLLETLRHHCGFKRTRTMASAIIERGRPADQPWVSYIYGKLHLARAAALARVPDQQGEWYEFDRAIKRFDEFVQPEMPASALATLMEAYISNGLSIHESVLALKWQDSRDVILYRLELAKTVLNKAAGVLQALADGRQQKVASGTVQARTAEDGRVDAMISHLGGLILYRQWLIEAQSRHRKGTIGYAETDAEKQKLQQAVTLFQTAENQSPPTPALLLDWGTTLRALRKFDDAVTKYRAAGDMMADDKVAPLKVVVALLEKSIHSDRPDEHFDAIRQASSYLTWVADGKPYNKRVDNLVKALEGALEGVEPERKKVFERCREKYDVPNAGVPAKAADLAPAAALKICVDEARENLFVRVVPATP